MRIKKKFVLREIAGEYVLVPVGEAARELNGIVTVNELGAFLWNLLQEEQTEQTLLNAVLDAYAVEEERARQDIRGFLPLLRNNHLMD